MKKLLYIVLGIEIIAAVISFFMLLYSSVFAAIFGTALNLLSIVPIIAIIYNIKDIEDIQYEMSKMRYALRKIEDMTKSDQETSEREEYKSGAAAGVWECIKCGTVNKEGTDCCENCKSAYSPVYNPTDDPNEKKKVSRWVKFK